MKSYEQRTENIVKKAQGITARRKAWVSAVACMCCVAIVFGIVFATLPSGNPSGGNPSNTGNLPIHSRPNVNPYDKNDYLSLIETIDDYKENGSKYANFAPRDSSGSLDDSADGEVAQGSDKYEESTLNQVIGVTEGDILKRSTNYAFYLTAVSDRAGHDESNYFKINAYSIRGKKSVLVGKLEVKGEEDMTFAAYWSLNYTSKAEMYLSDDAKTLTLVAECYYQDYYNYTCIVSLDVSNPSKMVEKSRIYVAGRYISSRKVNGELLLMTKFHVYSKDADFDNPETFIPSYVTSIGREYWQMDEIYCPNGITDSNYTVVAKLNESDLKVTSKQAVLSYTDDVAVSTEHIFIIRNIRENVQNDQILGNKSSLVEGPLYYRTFSEIVCLNYSDKITYVGCITLDGNVRDRYSLDEKDGVLRVVTQTTHDEFTVILEDDIYPCFILDASIRSASLYCVDLAKMEVVNSVENFAPNGETVQAVRFDGNSAYVCTAVVRTLTDPVFMFDLSDINNITYKDTGTIPGYSINLMKFGDYLLGIGYGDGNGSNIRRTLKIELYKETHSKVESVAIYEYSPCNFSTEYKAHFIDVEHQLVGLQICDYNKNFTNQYLLLQFDSKTQTWREVLRQEVSGKENLARAFYADGFYLISAGTPLKFFPERTLFK